MFLLYVELKNESNGGIGVSYKLLVWSKIRVEIFDHRLRCHRPFLTQLTFPHLREGESGPSQIRIDLRYMLKLVCDPAHLPLSHGFGPQPPTKM